MRLLKNFKKIKKKIFDPEKVKNGPQKLLIIGPDPFLLSIPGHSPQPRIDFSYHEISGPDICSLICDPYISEIKEFEFD